MTFSFKHIKGTIYRSWTHLRFRPIVVFCLHHISEQWDARVYPRIDWISTQSFHEGIQKLKKEFTFISLSSAFTHLKHDRFRFKKYAVLTFDDGYSSILSSLKWLEGQQIPYTLFLNARYLDGESYNPIVINWINGSGVDNEEQDLLKGFFISGKDLRALSTELCSIGSHGYDHLDATDLNEMEFDEHIKNNYKIINGYSNVIPFHAYTWGKHNAMTDRALQEMELIPVLMDGKDNYSDSSFIHRRLFPDSQAYNP